MSPESLNFSQLSPYSKTGQKLGVGNPPPPKVWDRQDPGIPNDCPSGCPPDIWNTPYKSSSYLLFEDTATLLGSSRILALPEVSRDGEGVYIHRYGLHRNLGAVLASGVVDALYHGGHDYMGGSHCLSASTARRGLGTGNSNSKRGSGNGWPCSSSFAP